MCTDLYLSHHGIKGQKWGIRRYQNEDGSLTSAGKSRYSNSSRFAEFKYKRLNKYADRGDKITEAGRDVDKEWLKKYRTAVGIGAASVATILAMHYMGVKGARVRIGSLPPVSLNSTVIAAGSSIASRILTSSANRNLKSVKMSNRRKAAYAQNPDNPYWAGDNPKFREWG